MSDRGLLERIGSHLVDRIKAIPGEAYQTLTDKVVPQGASEIAQALNSQSNAFVPYGHAQQPLDVEGPAQSYQDMLREASQRGGQEHGHEMGMDR